MHKYANKPMEALAAELTAGLKRLRKGYADAAEGLVQIIQTGREYPYEFVVYRLTGYRPPAAVSGRSPMPGKSLRQDLLWLILDICDSFELSTEDYPEPVYDSPALARRFNVSTKTIQRWRRQGLAARRLSFPDGRRRVAFLESSVRRFVSDRRGQVARSGRFTQMTEAQRQDVIRRARRMAGFCSCSLSDVVKRLARRTGRAMETIRYTIRRHDTEHPGGAVFPRLSSRLGEQEKTAIYRGFLRGVPIQAFAKQYHRTRGSIYRIVSEMRAKQLLERPIKYVHNPQFDLPNADEQIVAAMGEAEGRQANGRDLTHSEMPRNLPPYLKALYEVPLLLVTQERNLFRLYNYLKYKADKLRHRLDLNRLRTAQLREIEQLLLQANVTKNKIVRANLRLVVLIAKKHVGGAQSLFELISDGNVSLMLAVEKFDYSRGNRFSTYASWAIIRNFARSVPRERYHLDRFATGHEGILDIAAGLQIYDPNEVNPSELRESIDAVLAQLKPRERAILIEHYGLDDQGQTVTFDQLGRHLGISKERVRQIEIQALKKLRSILRPQKADLLW
ncbi:MAG: sigma-70 family RNA polymerase sigma factor [Phycisphaerae bacterium]|nr:sigma-70 family RNA polymerase sigma factor [Phycisphaerae bacterium]